jgi:hypothetical protein
VVIAGLQGAGTASDIAMWQSLPCDSLLCFEALEGGMPSMGVFGERA